MVLFDGMQSRFIFEDIDKETIRSHIRLMELKNAKVRNVFIGYNLDTPDL